MSALTEVYLRVSTSTSDGTRIDLELPPIRFSPGSGALPKVEQVSLTGSAFTALNPPAGSKAVLLRTGTVPLLTLKGISGDSASLTITPATNVLGGDHFLWLGLNPVLGLLNSGVTAPITVVWL